MLLGLRAKNCEISCVFEVSQKGVNYGERVVVDDVGLDPSVSLCKLEAALSSSRKAVLIPSLLYRSHNESRGWHSVRGTSSAIFPSYR